MVPVQTLGKVDSAPPITELGNPEDLIDVRRYSVKTIKKIMSVTEIKSKVYEPKTYEQAISNPIYARQ